MLHALERVARVVVVEQAVAALLDLLLELGKLVEIGDERQLHVVAQTRHVLGPLVLDELTLVVEVSRARPVGLVGVAQRVVEALAGALRLAQRVYVLVELFGQLARLTVLLLEVIHILLMRKTTTKTVFIVHVMFLANPIE